MDEVAEANERADEFRELFRALQSEIGKIVVGQDETVSCLLTALFAGGHVLLEGAPGLGKTMLVRALGTATGLDFSRVQFTPDLMPADITGTNLIVDEGGRRAFRFERGPVFTNLLLADEINRATPKTQSALLEAMQEHRVTAAGTSHPIPEPFLVLATQNPLEMEGTYPLPEAQLDRFLMKVLVSYPDGETLHEILERTTSQSEAAASRVLDSPERLLEFQRFVRGVPVVREVRERAVRLTLASHPECDGGSPLAKRFVRYGASPRGAQGMVLCAKIRAILGGRFHVAKSDIDAVAAPVLRHRIVLNFEAEAEGVTAEGIVREIISLPD